MMENQVEDPKTALKLLIICTNDFPDSFVREKFLNFTIQDVDDLDELVGALEKHRPNIAAEFSTMLGRQETE